MVTDAQKQDVVQYLNEYCFDNVWSAVNEKFRANFQLEPTNARLQSSVFTYDNAVVGLPTTGIYRVFRFEASLLRGTWGPHDSQWYTLDTIAETAGVKLTVYDVNGILLPMCSVWVLSPTASSSVFVAVHKPPLMQIVPDGINTDLYMTVFRNTKTIVSPWTAFSQQMVKTTDADTAIAAALAAPSGSAMVVINGTVYTDLTTLPARAVGDYVDVGIDPTIFVTYVVAVDDTDNGYSSVKYSGDREILHCPKALNPNQWILTHDGATLFVRDSTTKKGVYLHRVDPVSVKQITHNDFSVSRTTLDAFKAALGSSQIEVVVSVRALSSPRTLMAESGWIADLYLSDDADIVSHLRGVLDDTLTFWKASELEQSGYITLMFSDGDSTDITRLDDYVNSLGYYATGAILSTNIYNGTYDRSDLIFTKSYAQRGKIVTPLVYLSGVKVLQDQVTVMDHGNLRCSVSVANSAQLAQGQAAVIRTMDSGDPTPIRFVPTANTPTLTLSSDYASSVFAEKSDGTVSGYGRTADLAYCYTPAGLDTYQVFTPTDDTIQFTFAEDMYDVPVIVNPLRFMWYYTENIDGMLQNVEPLVFPITVETADGTVLPMLSYGNVEVYINGHYLVKDVDFTLSPLRGSTTNGSMLLDVIVNCSSFYDASKTGNTVEIYISSDQPTNQDAGYAVDNILPRSNLISFWYPLISSAFAEGVTISNLLDYAVYMVSDTGVPNGSLFELKPMLPEMISDILSDYSPITDETTIQTINTFYGRTAPAYGNVVTLDVQHRIYSTFITAIILDVVNNKLAIVDDADDATFVDQFVDYQYLKDRDPTLYNDDPRVDRRFLSVAASYAQPQPMTVVETRLIQRLIALTLITQPTVLKETLV